MRRKKNRWESERLPAWRKRKIKLEKKKESAAAFADEDSLDDEDSPEDEARLEEQMKRILHRYED